MRYICTACILLLLLIFNILNAEINRIMRNHLFPDNSRGCLLVIIVAFFWKKENKNNVNAKTDQRLLTLFGGGII
jgi:hypothetical protein